LGISSLKSKIVIFNIWKNAPANCGPSVCRYFSFPNFDGGTRVKTKRRTDEGGEKVTDEQRVRKIIKERSSFLILVFVS
jgi:hypothetical protein